MPHALRPSLKKLKHFHIVCSGSSILVIQNEFNKFSLGSKINTMPRLKVFRNTKILPAHLLWAAGPRREVLLLSVGLAGASSHPGWLIHGWSWC